MQAKTATSENLRRPPSHPIYVNEGLSPKKTAFIIVTVIGCIAILWPKVFYPMMFGGSPATDLHKHSNLRDQKGPPLGLRQERPAHLHPDSVYQAMRERGRAIPATPTIPIVDRQGSASKPRFVEGRPGPIPGMRPPMGAGSIHQPQAKGNSVGFLMPLYTIGIVVFFGYTIMKLVLKKRGPNAPYNTAPTDPRFRKEVFGQENGRHVEELNGSKIVVTAIQGLIDAADEQLKLREQNATSDLKKISNENSTSNIADISSEHTENDNQCSTENKAVANSDGDQTKFERKQRGGSADRSVASKPDHNEDHPEPHSIYLEGSLAHESQILVSDSEIKTEKVYDSELNGSPEEPAVILSSKMTLSLINLDANQEDKKEQQDIDSPLADDIEIISPYEQ